MVQLRTEGPSSPATAGNSPPGTEAVLLQKQDEKLLPLYALYKQRPLSSSSSLSLSLVRPDKEETEVLSFFEGLGWVEIIVEIDCEKAVENMKNLYPKGKGRIHPSPGSPSSGGGGGSPSGDAMAVLKLLPAAILVLTAALGDDDKEVLAYLITRCVNGPAAVVAGVGADRRRYCKPGMGVHRPMLDCGCFDCYRSFWSRWDCSPDREIIHQAIEAFEEHLASSESGGAGGSGRSRRRERRAAGRAEKERNSEKGKSSKKSKDKEKNKLEEKEESVADEATPVSVSESYSATEEERASAEDEAVRGEDKAEEVSGTAMELVAVEQPSERRRGWPDVMGLLNSRLWSLWNPGA